jgi:hypothetical protein
MKRDERRTGETAGRPAGAVYSAFTEQGVGDGWIGRSERNSGHRNASKVRLVRPSVSRCEEMATILSIVVPSPQLEGGAF